MANQRKNLARIHDFIVEQYITWLKDLNPKELTSHSERLSNAINTFTTCNPIGLFLSCLLFTCSFHLLCQFITISVKGAPPAFMASWDIAATISTLFTLQDISNASAIYDEKDETPVLQMIAAARSKDYDAIAMPLTTEMWKKRWSDMCLLPLGSDPDMEIAAEQKAEAWRSRPYFMNDEVTLTRLGEFITLG